MTEHEDSRVTEAKRWLVVCGHCDAGLPQACVCPEGDPRSVIQGVLDWGTERYRVNVGLLMENTELKRRAERAPDPDVGLLLKDATAEQLWEELGTRL